ncbi:MAG: NUDIX domain-containing protein [Parachlamydia sp.]|nr:NUDIX domain-containing protein [Parachlamydia sp.]
MDYQTFKLTPQFRIEVAESPRGFTLSDYEKARVEMLWLEEVAAHPSTTFNGQILNFLSLEGERLLGEFVDYKFYLAQLRDPQLQPSLQITPVTISGLTFSGNKVLFGRRSQEVTQYRGLYEAVPSGGIDPHALQGGQIDLKEQFQRELWEETGISVTEVKGIQPFLLVYDPSTHMYEICAVIEVNYPVVSEERKPTAEYQEFIWVSKSEMKSFTAKHSAEFVPFSLYLLKAWKI